MKRTLLMTAALIFGGQMAFAAIDPHALADSYVAEGYSYVEVKQGPTQTKLEAIKGANAVEVVYDNASGAIISQESQKADAEQLAQTGVEVKTTTKDFADAADQNDDGTAAGTEDDGTDEAADGSDDGAGDSAGGDGHDGEGHDGGDQGGDSGGDGGGNDGGSD